MNPTADDLLSFKEFPPVHGNQVNRSDTAEISINSPQRTSGKSYDPLQDLINDMSNSAKVLANEDAMQAQEGVSDGGGGDGAQKPAGYSFWSIEYYQQFFNVDTMMVLDRIASSVIPKRAPSNYLKSHIGLNPDLYGPFWIMVTLIFSIAISGNVASYLHHANNEFHWRYNFHLVSYAATAIFIYSCFIPLALWGMLKWSLKPVDEDIETESSGYTPSLLSLICIYGYSLAIYIPVSILWVIPISVLQWILVITAALLSGLVLIFVLTPALRNSNFSLFLIIGIVGAHFLLAAGFMLYFFHVPSDSAIAEKIVKTVTEAAAPIKIPVVI